MREKWAIGIVFLTALIVLFLGFVFARIQNPNHIADTTKKIEMIPATKLLQSGVLDPNRIEAGKQIYMQQSCALCHSISGHGNPRNPLDGIGRKHTASDLSKFITGADMLQGILPESIRKAKHKYRKLSDNDLDALIIYLKSLT